MQTSAPLVSVVIPVYNGVNFLADAITSVLTQSYDNLELVICDDASTDATIDLVRTFGDPRVRVVSHSDNVGYAANFTRAARLATGEFVTLLCHDDVMDEDFLEEGVRAFAHADSRVVLVSARRRVIRPDGRRTRLTRGLVRRTRSVAGSTAIRRCIRSASNLIGESSFVLVRRGDLVDALPFRMSYVVDLEMWTRILHDRDCIAIARALGSFRLSATSGTTAQRHSQARQVRDFIHHVHRTTPGLLRPTDRCAGIVRAQINQLLRRIVIRILTR